MKRLAAIAALLFALASLTAGNAATAPAAQAGVQSPSAPAAQAGVQSPSAMAWGGSHAGNAALNWAQSHAAGHWYGYGGTGPSVYDCSGLVYAAFKAEGITLPRVSYSMPSSSRLHYIPWQQAQRGDILVWGSVRSPSHVGFKTAWPWTSFEARNSGLRIWWMSYYYFRPVAAYRVW
jgi:cell wall-associated NlpC family hydrolase